MAEEKRTDAEVRKEKLGIYNNTSANYSGRYRPVNNESYSKLDSDYTYKGGFYYDSQLEDPYLSVSLHANTKIIGGEWKTWPGEHLPACSEAPESGNYGVDPIARCIMSEDFSYSIGNNFSDYNAGNPIEDLFNSAKPYAPILGKFGANAKKAADSTKDDPSSLVAMLSTGMSKISDLMSKTSNYLNKALFVQGSRFSYYNGTTFNFNNMEMKFIVFSDYVTTDGGSTWEFQSVEDYIKTLQPYVMGIYSKYNADFLSSGGWSGEARQFIADYVGFQDPPGGFEMDTKNLNNVLKGTLRLNIGGTWAIDNLVIKGMNVNMSRTQAKDPTTPGGTVPLYAEISLQLAPACAIVDQGYRGILEHKGMKELRTAVTNEYSTKLKDLKKKYVSKT